jgi:hypothetical protein
MKILMVLTSHGELGETGKKTGFWLEEFAAPYYGLAVANAGRIPHGVSSVLQPIISAAK